MSIWIDFFLYTFDSYMKRLIIRRFFKAFFIRNFIHIYVPYNNTLTLLYWHIC